MVEGCPVNRRRGPRDAVMAACTCQSEQAGMLGWLLVTGGAGGFGQGEVVIDVATGARELPVFARQGKTRLVMVEGQ